MRASPYGVPILQVLLRIVRLAYRAGWTGSKLPTAINENFFIAAQLHGHHERRNHGIAGASVWIAPRRGASLPALFKESGRHLHKEFSSGSLWTQRLTGRRKRKAMIGHQSACQQATHEHDTGSRAYSEDLMPQLEALANQMSHLFQNQTILSPPGYRLAGSQLPRCLCKILTPE